MNERLVDEFRSCQGLWIRRLKLFDQKRLQAAELSEPVHFGLERSTRVGVDGRRQEGQAVFQVGHHRLLGGVLPHGLGYQCLEPLLLSCDVRELVGEKGPLCIELLELARGMGPLREEPFDV
jgi:hypothetical protein